MTLRDKLKFWILLSSYVEMIVRGTSPLSLANAIADSLEYLKAFGGTEQRNLPEGYTELEYIESTGTQYIDTGIQAGTTSFGVEIDYYIESLPSSIAAIMGNEKSTNFPWIGYVTGASGGLSVTMGATDNQGWTRLYGGVSRDTGRHSFKFTNNYSQANLIFDGVDKGSVSSFPYYDIGLNLYLFANNKSSSGAYQFLSGRIYSAKIYNNSTLVRDFVPVRRNTDGAIGMYDMVSETFFGNAGSGTFTAGPDATPTPDNPIDIWCNNGVLKYGYQSANMFDKNSTLADNRIWAPSFTQQDLNGYYGTNIIKVTGGHTYTRSGSHGSANYFKLSDGTYTQTSDSSDTITVPNNAVEWVFNNTAATDRETMMVVEGSSLPEEYVPYKGYGIYTDGTVETINVHGKNLFDISTATPTMGINAATGEMDSISVGVSASNYIPVSGGKKYTLNTQLWITNSSGIAWYNANKEYISGQTYTGLAAQTFTAPASAYYIRITVRTDRDPFQFEEGSSATSYEPYFDGGTATCEDLLSVGTYEDTQEVLSGAITHNVGVIVLDGTENWTVNSMISHHFSYKLPNQFDSTVAYMPTYCTHFLSDSGEDDNTCKLQYRRFSIRYDAANENVATFKQFLADQYAAATPVIVVYPLATPTTESVAGQTMQVQQGDNIVEITQASLDNLELEVKYKKQA